MKYEITIRELTPFTEDEMIEMNKRANPSNFPFDDKRYSDRSFHETRVLFAEVSKEELEAVKKAIISLL